MVAKNLRLVELLLTSPPTASPSKVLRDMLYKAYDKSTASEVRCSQMNGNITFSSAAKRLHRILNKAVCGVSVTAPPARSKWRASKRQAIEHNGTPVHQRHHASFQEKFFQACDKELMKVNTFHAEKLAEAQRRCTTLGTELEMVLEAHKETRSSPFRKQKRSLHKSYSHRAQHKTLCDLKLAFSELYLSLVLLQNYQNLNYMGFSKITEKHDKLFGTQRGNEWKMFGVDMSPFYTSKKSDQLIQEVESLFINQLEGGDRQKAMKRLRVPPLGAAQSAPIWTTFRVGLFSGLVIAFALLISVTVFHTSRVITIWPLLRLYRGGFLIIEFIFLLGINNYGWRKAGVNHILIFELDPRDNLSYLHLFELAGFLGVTWCVSVLNCLHSALLPLPLQVNPLAFYIFLVLLLLNPTRTFYYKSRVWLLKLIYKVGTAPFHKVGFADFWLADQLNSLTPVFVDFWGLCCFYIFDVDWQSLRALSLYPADIQCTGNTTGVTSFIQCIPAWLRFAQCLRRYWDSRRIFPHLVNAGKYATVFVMVAFAALFSNEKDWPSVTVGVKFYFYAWIITACVGTIFTTTWDLKMDWGLLERNTQENKFLRDETVYPKRVYYYCAIAGDVILRVSWAVNIFYAQDRYSEVAELVTSVLAPLEVFRRFIWNFFRLENEHLNNCGQFRAVRDISVAPLHVDSQTALEHIMDQEGGVRSHRRGRGSKKKNKFSLRRVKGRARETRICVEEMDEEPTNTRQRTGSEPASCRTVRCSMDVQP
ncbi:solute carrier family 53 member 1-like [Ascaphus truei]|uniref:solute carrier family 53 member 1-like n=1 Tax=Ascaphus truei TaxID=8439 RepID=UPI003F5984BC